MLPTDRRAGVCTAVEGCLGSASLGSIPLYSHQQVHESSADTALDNGLDLVVGSVRQVADSPASVDQNLVVEGVDELGEDSEGRGDLTSVTAEIMIE